MSSKSLKIGKTRKYDWSSSLKQLEGAYAKGTVRAYRADIQTYIDWCASKKVAPLPATSDMIAAFISHQAQSYSNATIKRRLAAISKTHELLNLDNPNYKPAVKLALRRALRAKLSRPRQALGMSAQIRDQLIEGCKEDLSGKRDKALISIGYDTLCRRSEIVNIQVEDVKIFDNLNGRILIRRSKSDPQGMGRFAHISPRSIYFLNEWLKASNIDDSYIFRPIKSNLVQAHGLHPHSVNRIIKKAAASAGLSDATICRLSGHSMRIGAAQEMMKQGLGLLPIMIAGGWKTTNVVARYVENSDMVQILYEFLHR
jgi:integrase/recombinase XerD